MGKADTLETLVEYYRTQGDLALDFNVKDNNDDTPLSLLCMRGYSNHVELADHSTVCAKRQRMVGLIIPLMETSTFFQPSRNSALHWCVYNGDVGSGIKIFNEVPELIMQKNIFGETPVDLFILKKVRLYMYPKSITLLQHVCSSFGLLLMDFVENDNRSEKVLDAEVFSLLNQLAENVKKTKEIDQFANDYSPNKMYLYSKKDAMMKKDFVRFLHILFIGGVILNIPKLTRFLMESLGISPFWRGVQNKSALHYASELKNTAILRTILGFEYFYINQNRGMDLEKKVLKARESDGNIGLHFAALRGNLPNFNLLKTSNSKGLEIKNQRILKPQECTRNPEFGSTLEMNKKAFFSNLETQNENLTSPTSYIKALEGRVAHGYLYAIVCRDRNEVPEQTLIYKQLNRVNQLFGMNKDNKGKFHRGRARNMNPFHSNVSVYRDELIIGGDPENNIEDEQEEFLGGNGDAQEAEIFESNGFDQEIYEKIEFEGNLIKVKWVELEDYSVAKRGFFRHCYLVGLNESGIDEIANILNLKVYNHGKEMPDYFDISHRSRFEQFRDSQLQTMLLFMLEREFDIEYFEENGIVESHFFLHESPKNLAIPSEYYGNHMRLVVDNLLPKSSKKSLLNGMGTINHYLGPDTGLYLGFNNLYTSWLIFLSIVGVVTSILIYTLARGDFDYEGLPVYGVIIILVVTFVDQFWKRRESELVYLWDLRAYSMNEPQRKEHKGKFIIDRISREIRKKNPLSTSQRRLITEIPVILLGLFFIIGNYVLFYFLNKNMTEKKNSGAISKDDAKFYGMIIGGCNGVSISVLNQIYQAVVNAIISWENHRYESTLKGSLIPKIFLFNFCMHYINLFFYAFYLQDFLVLRSNFISLFITRAVSNLSITYGLPLFLYWFKKKMLRKKLEQKWKSRKNAFLRRNAISDKWFYDVSPLIQGELKDYERELYLWFQIEEALARPAPFDMNLIWMNQLLQFGLLVFFGLVYPLAPVVGLVYNLLDSYLLSFCASKVNRRPKIIILPNAGIWTYMITLMTFIALVINTSLFAFVSHGFRDLVDVNGDYNLLLLLVLSEHVVLALKVLLSFVISDVPGWVSTAIKNRKTKKRMYVKSKNEKKILKRLTRQITGENLGSFINKVGKQTSPVDDESEKFNHLISGLQKKKVKREKEKGSEFAVPIEALRNLKNLRAEQFDENGMDLQSEEEMEREMLCGLNPPNSQY